MRFDFNFSLVLVWALWIPYSLASAQETESPDPETELSSEQEEQPESLFEAVREFVRNGEVRDGIDLIESRLKSEENPPSPSQVRRSYLLIVAAFRRMQNPREMYRQLEKLHDYQIKVLNEGQEPGRFSATFAGMSSIAESVDKQEDFLNRLNATIDRLAKTVDVDQISPKLVDLSSLRALRIQELLQSGQREKAHEISQSEYDTLKPLYEANPENDAALAIFTRSVLLLMRSTEDRERQNELYREHQKIVRQRIEDHPENMGYLARFLAATSQFVAINLESDPEAALEEVETGLDMLSVVEMANEDAERVMRVQKTALTRLKRRIEGRIKIAQLIDQPAPELSSDTWLNGDRLPAEEREGKVILLHFWAVWSKPCTRTFPKLKEWHDTYHDQGLRMIGVTRHYNYRWDDEEDGPVRAEARVEAEEENRAIRLFMQKHELPYPTLVADSESSIIQEFGVTAIPQVVLIDREGVVRLIEVGSSEDKVNAVAAGIKELLED